MPNSTNPRSTSASQPPTPEETDAPEVNGAAEGGHVPNAPADNSSAKPEAPPSETDQSHSDGDVPLQPPPPPPKPEIVVNPDVHRRGMTGRSLRMQLRYVRTLLWAARLFVRILFWQWVVKRVMGEEFVRRCNVSRWKQYAREFRAFAAKMGGVFIKAGQFISTRADIFPEEIIMELAGLQDEVPAVPFKKIEGVLNAELGAEYHTHFRWLREEPIAAASLGQVHRAQLVNGDRVVVKVQRPGITRIVDTDLAALMVVAHVAMRFKFISRRANAVEITREFGNVLWEEVSYLHEAQNLQHFARIFQDNMEIYIPLAYDDISTDRVLVMEDVTSIKINDYERLEKEGVSRKEVARRLMRSYLVQVFDKQFFHADPHPGNLFVYPLPVEEGQTFGTEGRPFYLIYVDFGMTGRLTQQIVDGLVSTLIAIVTRDAHRLVQSYQELGLLLPGADTERLEQATKATFDQVWGMNMQDLSSVDYEVMEQLGTEFNDLLFDMPFRVPQNFIYLGRTMGILSGMSTSLDPDFNPWRELQPYAEKMMRLRASSGESLGGQFGESLLQTLVGAGSSILGGGAQIITRAVAPNSTAHSEALIEHLKSGEVRVTSDPGRKWQLELHLLTVQIRTLIRAVMFAGILVSSTLLLTSGMVWLAAGGYVVCVMVGWQIIFPPNVLK